MGISPATGYGSSESDYTSYEKQSPREQAIVDMAFALFEQLNMWRVNFASQWEETAELIMPNSRNTFYRWNVNFPGMKKTDKQVDASGMLALTRFGAILDSLLTPRNMTWHTLEPDNEYVKKDRATQLWFLDATRILFKQRYMPNANFMSQNQQNWKSLGAFGNAGMFIDQLVGVHNEPIRGLRYKSLPIGEIFIRENHQGRVDGFVRAFRLTARQALARWGTKCPAKLFTAAKAQSEQLYDFFHICVPNQEYEPLRMDNAGKPFASYYVSVEGRCLLQEGGYISFPLAFSRYDQAPWEVYGRGPAMDVLPALKTLNAQKRTFLKSGHRAGDPILLTADDGLIDISLRPGAIVKGGVNSEGQELVKVLPTGQIQITKEMMDEERSLINDEFLISLFQIMTESPQMTATEVVERINEKGILIAPTVGRQQSEYLGPMIERELDLLMDMRLLPPMPPRLREARGEYHVVYTSPLARSQRAQEASGFLRTVESALGIAGQMQDPSILFPFKFKKAFPAIAEIQNVPADWMNTDEEVTQLEQQHAQAQQQQAQVNSLPGQAAMLKAQAVVAKSGGNVANGTPGAPQPAAQRGGPPQQAAA